MRFSRFFGLSFFEVLLKDCFFFYFFVLFNFIQNKKNVFFNFAFNVNINSVISTIKSMAFSCYPYITL